MKRTDKGKSVLVEFDGPEDILDYIGDVPDKNTSHEYRPRFIKYSWEETVQALRQGWPEGIADIDSVVKAIEAGEESTKRITYGRDVEGLAVDIGAFLSGVPECFITQEVEEIRRETVHVTVNSTFSGSINQEYIIKRGAVIAALIDKLSQDKDVHVTVVIKAGNCPAGRKDGRRNYIDIEMITRLRMEQSYSRDLLAFYCAHPGCLRRVYFAVAEKITSRRDCDGYGSPRDTATKHRNEIYFPMVDAPGLAKQQFGSIESARETLEGLLAKYQRKES